MGFWYLKWPHRSHGLNKKKRQVSNLYLGREKYKKLPKSGGLLWLVDFEGFLVYFSGYSEVRDLPFFLLSPCDLCDHFKYHKPIFFYKIFLGPSLGQLIFQWPASIGRRAPKTKCF